MKIAYCSALRLPSERAYGHQVARVCDALAKLGHEVEIFAPDRKNTVTADFWSYHGVHRSVRLTLVPSFDGIASPWTPGVIGLKLHIRSYAKNLLKMLKGNRADVIYTRTPSLVPALLSSGLPVVLELHTLPRFFRKRFVRHASRCGKIICLTTPMQEELVRWGVPESLTMIEGDAVDLDAFAALPSKAEARAILGLPKDALIVGYAGSLKTMGLSKGAEQIAEAAVILHERFPQLEAVIAGGPQDAADALRRAAPPSVRVLGPLSYSEALALMVASDVLVYPAPRSTHSYFQRDTSPLKIFEYMAAERPIVAADIPPVHDALDTDLASFYEPGDAVGLADAVSELLNNPSRADTLATNARRTVLAHTWQTRMQRIVSAISR